LRLKILENLTASLNSEFTGLIKKIVLKKIKNKKINSRTELKI